MQESSSAVVSQSNQACMPLSRRNTAQDLGSLAGDVSRHALVLRQYVTTSVIRKSHTAIFFSEISRVINSSDTPARERHRPLMRGRIMHISIPARRQQKKKGSVATQKKKQRSEGRRLKASARAPPRRAQPRLSSNGNRMSKCAAKYAVACVTPFDNQARGCCIPKSPNFPSQKVAVRTVFQMSVPGNYRGGIFITPTVANDLPIAYATSLDYQGSFDGGDTCILSAPNTVVTGMNRIIQTTAPYPGSTFVNGHVRDRSALQSRVVAVGVKVTCVSPALYRAGTLLSYMSPRHQNVSGFSYSSCASQSITRMMSVGPSAIELCLSAVNESEVEYTDALEGTTSTPLLYPFSGGTTGFAPTCDAASTAGGYTDSLNGHNIGVPIAVIFIDPSSNQQTFNVEIINHLEFTGDIVQPFVTPNEADDVGFAKVQQAKEVIMEKTASDPYASARDLAGNALRSVYNVAKEIPVETLVSAFSQMRRASHVEPNWITLA